MTILLSTAYLGPIQYFTKFLLAETIIFERFEHFPKQSYRNRCIIYGANGPQTLTIPVTKDKIKEYTRDIRIDYSANWLKNHLKSIESAYNNSPFYPYFIDELFSVFEKKETFLYDLNFKLMQTINTIIGISPEIKESDDYITTIPKNSLDFRECIHPKPRLHKPDNTFIAPEYPQVFADKHGFFENLSIIDLIFNTGPDCKTLLLNSLKNS